MRILGIITATMAALGSLIYAVFWQTPAVEALALIVCGGLLTALAAWFIRPHLPTSLTQRDGHYGH